jgi:DNA-binding MarR family transcriptional regulator
MNGQGEVNCPPQDSAVLDEEIIQLILDLAKRLSAYFETQVIDMDLTGPQALLLRHLEAPMSMNQVACKLHCDASNVTGIVDRLEARGLLERRPVPSDRRVKQLVLTEEGTRYQRRIEALLGGVPGLSRLSEDERLALRDLLLHTLWDSQDSAIGTVGGCSEKAESTNQDLLGIEVAPRQ